MKFLRIMLRIRVDFDCVFRRCMSQLGEHVIQFNPEVWVVFHLSQWYPGHIIHTFTLTLVACRSL